MNVIERLDTELRDRTVVGDRGQQGGHFGAQLVDLGARLGDVGGGVDRVGAVLNSSC